MIDIPQLREGQSVRVFQKIKEGKRERNVPFTGKLIKVRGVGSNRMITVRQTLGGVDVDKIFPVLLPSLTKIEVLTQTKSLVKGQPVQLKKSRKRR
jgi:large subunit ribosomal protein L19